MLERGEFHAGMILAQQGYSVGEQMRRLLRLIAAKSAEDMHNQVEFLNAWTEEYSSSFTISPCLEKGKAIAIY